MQNLKDLAAAKLSPSHLPRQPFFSFCYHLYFIEFICPRYFNHRTSLKENRHLSWDCIFPFTVKFYHTVQFIINWTRNIAIISFLWMELYHTIKSFNKQCKLLHMSNVSSLLHCILQNKLQFTNATITKNMQIICFYFFHLFW